MNEICVKHELTLKGPNIFKLYGVYYKNVYISRFFESEIINDSFENAIIEFKKFINYILKTYEANISIDSNGYITLYDSENNQYRLDIFKRLINDQFTSYDFETYKEYIECIYN